MLSILPSYGYRKSFLFGSKIAMKQGDNRKCTPFAYQIELAVNSGRGAFRDNGKLEARKVQIAVNKSLVLLNFLKH